MAQLPDDLFAHSFEKPEIQPIENDFDSLLEEKSKSHRITIQTLNDLFEVISHKTTITIIALILLIAYVATKYLGIIHKSWEVLHVINADLETLFKYFITIVLTYIITKLFDK